MSNAKHIVMNLSKAEVKKQIEELSYALLPEAISGGHYECKDKVNLLAWAVNSDKHGYDLLYLIEVRSQMVQAKANNPNYLDSPATLPAIDRRIENIKSILNNGQLNFATLNTLIRDCILVGYDAGSHDMIMKMGRSAIAGFKKNSVDTSNGGKKKSMKVTPLKNVIVTMANYLYESPKIGRANKSIITAAIFHRLHEFKNLSNKQFECFSNFTNNEIKQEFIEKQFNHVIMTSQKKQSLH